MSRIDTLKSQKTQAFEHLNGSGKSAQTTKGDATLFAEFSEILDKIAFKLGNTGKSQQISDRPVETSQVKEEQLREPENSGQEVIEDSESVDHTCTCDHEEEKVQATAADEAAESEEEEEVEEETEAADEDAEKIDDEDSDESQVVAAEAQVLPEDVSTVAAATQSQQAQAVSSEVKETTAPEAAEQQEVVDPKLAELRERVRVHTEAASQNEQKQQLHQNLEKSIQDFEQLVVDNNIQDTPVAKIADAIIKQLDKGEGKATPVLEKILNDFIEAAELQQSLQSPETQLATLLSQRIMGPMMDQNVLGKFRDVFGKDNAVQNIQSQGQDSSLMKNKSEAGSESSAAEKTAPKLLTKSNALRTMERVEQALKSAAESRDGKSISLRLDPPSLGNVRVDVSIRDGVLHARVSADNPAVNQMLRERAHELQRSLRDLGLEVDQVSVNVQGDGSNTGENFNPSENSSNASEMESEGDVLQGTSSGDEDDDENGGAVVLPGNNQPVEDHWVA